MRYVMLLVDQLDRAARELATDHAINNRIAMILVDNAAELIVHHRLEFHLAFEGHVQKLSPKQRLMAKGQHWGERLKVLRYLDDLSEEEHEFLKVAHHYRGELYHAGLRHDSIIRAITVRYFRLVCDLFVRLPRGFRAHHSNEVLTDTLAKYVGSGDSLSRLHTDVARIAARLCAELPPERPLQPILAQAARRALDRMEDRMNFLVEENPSGTALPEILRLAQHNLDFTRALARDGVEGTWMTPGYNEKVEEVRQEMAATWQPKHGRVPLAKWRARADTFEKEPDDLRSLALFHSLRGDMAYLDEAIGELAADLDALIQDGVDRLRGK